MEENASRKWLYDKFISEGLNVGENYAEFDSLITNNEESRKWAYDKARLLGYNVGKDYAEFENLVNPKISNTTEPLESSPTFSMTELRQMEEQGNDEKSTDVFQPSAGDIAKFHAQRKQMENSLQQQHDAFSDRYRNLQEYNTHVGNGQVVESGVQFNPKTKEVEKTYITPLGNKTTDKAVADAESQQYRQSTDMTVGGQLRKAGDRLTRLKAKAEARRAEIKEEWEQNQSKADGLGKFLTGLKEQHSGLSNVDALIDADDEYNALRAAIHQTEEQIGTLERQHDRDKGIDVGFWRGFGDVVGNSRTWDFGMGDLRDAVTMVKASSDNTDKTDGVKAAEQELLQSAYDNEQTQSQYGGNDDFWYRAGTMTGHMPAFMVDFAATGGGFGAIKVATKGAAKYATKAVGKEVVEEIAKQGAIRYVKDNGVKGLGQYATNWTIKALGTTADDLLIRAPLMTNTVQFGKTTSDIIERKLGDVVVNEDGTYDFSNDKTWGSAIWQGEANAIIENYSEMFGAHLDPVATLRNMSELANVVGAKRIGAVLSKANAGALSGIMGQTHQLFNKMGVSDYFGEVTEEYYGQMWRTMLNLDDAYQQNADGTRTNLLDTWQFHGDILGGMALSMGVMNAGKYTLTGAQYVSMKHGVNKADAHATELLGKEIWEPLRATIDLTTNDDIGSVAEGIVNDKDFTDDERAAVLTYMERSLMMRGFNLGTLARKRGAEQDEDVQAMDESYIDGYNICSAQEMADAKNMYEQQRKKLEEMLPMEAVEDIDRDPLGALGKLGDDATTNEAVIDYINAKQVRDGMIQRVRDDIDGQIERSNAAINARTNRTTGMIQGATMKQDDRRVYVVSGTVVPYNDGSGIDKAKSSGMIIVRDAESGKLEPVSADAILGVDAPLNPADEKAIAAEAIREQIAQEAADKIDGVVTFNPGDTYTITGDDAQIQVQVVANEEGIVDNGDGTVNVSDGVNIFPLAKETIQQQVEEANLARVAQFEQQRAIENAERRKAPTPEIAMPEYVMNDKVTLRDADGNIVNGAIEEVNADGVVFAVDNPITKMWNTKRYKKEDFDSQIVSIERDGKELWKEPVKKDFPTIKPVGENKWGKIYRWAKGKVKDAANYLLKQKSGVAQGVLQRNDIGDIDLVWGNDKAGLQHMILRHVVEQSDFNSVDELVTSIEDVVSNGELSSYNNNLIFRKDGYKAVVIKDSDGNFVLTAYDTTRKSGDKKRGEADATRLYQSIFENGNGNLVSQNSASPYKDNKNNSEDLLSLQNKTENDEVSERISQGGGRVRTERSWQEVEDNNNSEEYEQREVEGVQRALHPINTLTEAHVTGGSNSTATQVGRSSRKKESLLGNVVRSSKRNKTWIEDVREIARERIGSGQENEVYLSKDGKSVIKVNSFEYLPEDSEDFTDFINRVETHNELFPDVPLTILGYTENSDGKVSVVMSQPLVEAQREATDAEIDAFLEDMGFYTDMSGDWTNGDIVIADVKPANVLVDTKGNIHFIDALVYDERKGGKMMRIPPRSSKVDENRPQTALERMPKDEQGNPIYEQADSDTAWDAIVEQTEGDEAMAQTVADGMVADKEAALKKLEKTKSKGGVSIAEKIAAEKERKAAIDAAKSELDIWKKIASVHSERNKAAQWAAEAEAKRAALEKKRISAQEKAESESAPRNYAKAYDTWGTPINFRDYLLRAISSRGMLFKWKDSGNGTGGLGNHLGLANSNEERRKRMWLIDEVNGFYPEEAAEYALPDYKTQTGMNPNMDTSDALNEILDILGSYDNAKSMWDEAKQIHDRIESGEIAPQMSDEYEERYQWYMDNLHASPEDYEAYMETMLSEDIVLSEEDYNNLISEYIDGQGTIQAESERSNQILQGTQPVPTTGTGTIPTESSEVGERVNSEDGTAPADNRQDVVGRSLTADEAESLIIGMEERAEIAPDVELTIENWDALFGEEGKVITPIGVVKMGENQFTKLMRQGRDGKLGMIKPTLEHPHAIVEDESEAKEDDVTERASSYVFIRSFKKTDGSRYYYFTSVTVSKDGKEVVISNQEKRRKAIANLLINGKLVWKHADDVSTASDVADGLYSSQGNLSDPTTEGTVAPQTNISDSKGTANSPNSNELGEKVAKVSEKLWKVTNFLNYKYGYNFETENDFYNWIVKKKKTPKNIRSWLAGKLPKDLVSEYLTTILEYGKLNAEVSTSQHQYTPTLSQESEQVIDQDTAPYSIVPAQYTTKKGKVLDMHLLKFSENLTKEQQRAAKELAKIDKGWYDREQGGFMMRSEEDAKRLAETVLHNGDAVKDAQPISIADIKAVNDGGVISAESQQSDVTSTKEKPGYTIKKNDKGIYPYSVTFDDNAFNIHQNEDVTAAAVAMGGIKRPESFGGGYSFKDKNAAVAFAQSMTKEKPQQNQSASSQENGQDLTTGSSIDIDAESTAKVTINPYGAKYELNNLVHKYAGQRKTRGFISDLASALGDRASKQTYYFEFKDKAGNVYTLRISNHNVNANNADENEKEISIVIKSRRQPNKFIPSNAYIKEYVYFKESIANGDGQTLAWIAQDIATMLDTGVYADNSGVAVINTSPIREEAVKEETNPSGNRLVTDERYAELSERMRKKLGGQMNIGIDPEILAIGTEMAVYHLEKGARKFTEYAKAMIADLGDAIRPYLKAFYNGARNLPEVESSEIAADMSSYDEVQTIDVANFDKPGIDALATAETVAREAEVEQEVEIAQERIKKNRNKQTAEDAISAYIKNFNGAKYLDIEVFNNPDELYEFIIEDGDSETDARTFVNSVSTDRKAGGYDPYTNKILIFAWNNTNYYVSLFHEHCHSAISDLGGIKRFAMLANELAELKPKINRQIRQHYAKDWQEEIITYSLEDGLRNDSMDSIRKDLSTEARSLLDEILIHTGYERKQNGKDYISRFEPGGRTLSLHELRDPLDKRLSSKASGEKTRDSRDASDGNIGIGFGRGGRLAYREINGRKENHRRIKGGGRQNERSTRFLTQEDKIVTRQSGNGQGSLFDETLINDNEDGLQRTDAVRTEGLPSDNNLNAGTGSEKISSQEVRQDGRGTDGIRVGRSGRTIDDVSQGNGRPAGRLSGITEKKNTHNNHSERGKDHAPTSVDARIEANIKAIELAKQLLESGEKATEKQMQTLRKFSGWGGLGKVFNERANYTHEGRHYYNEPTIENKKLRELLGEKAYQEAVMSANSAYYTPAYVVDTLWDIAEKMGFEGGNILEGSAGIGNILGQMPTHISERSNIHAIEIDGTSGDILSLLYPDANVEIQGFEQTHIANGSVDLAITNVPFVTGLRVNDTTGDKDLSKKFHNIHDFCIAKNVRKLREGGLGIFITSNGTLDNSKKLRDWIVNEGGADFVGAFRMHNKTFGGTGVTSDIIVIRKRVNGQKSANAIDVSTVTGERVTYYDTGEMRKKNGKATPVIKLLSMDYNRYFIEHPENMAGEMHFAFEKGDRFRPTSKGLYPKQDKKQEQMLAEFVQSFTAEDAERLGTHIDTGVVEAVPGKKIGEMFVKDGKLYINSIAGARLLEVNANKVKGHTKVECFEAYTAIKEALAEVLAYQTGNESDEGLKPLLDNLNRAYDDFVATYGHFNKNTAIAFLRNDVDYANVSSVETFEELGDGKGGVTRTFGLADVMKGRVVEKEKEPTPTNVKDGIIASIFKSGRVDIPYIAEQLGTGIADVKKEIIESGYGFENPATRQIEASYQYLSGNVREKLRQAEENNENGAFDRNIKALQEVMPMEIPAHLIDFTLGSSWIDPKLYDEYVKERTEVAVQFTSVGGTWFMKEPYFTAYEKNRAMGVTSEMLGRTVMGHTLIEAAIQNRSVTVSTTKKNWDGSTETITDKEATQACAAKIDEIRQDFKDWARQKMQSDPEMSAVIERIYNDTFNNFVPMSIPDEFAPEHFPGANPKIKMYAHQSRAIVIGIQQPLLLAHEVGTGKTFTLISTAMEMRRLGTARKPMIVVQNATVGQFVASAKELYPNAKILTLEEADRGAEGRKNFYAKIRYNDWDMIVVPQSAFEFIPDSEEREMAFVQDKIEEKMLILEKMKEEDPDGKSMITRQAEREIELLEEQLAGISDKASKKRTANDEKKRAVALQNAEVKAMEMLDRRTDDVENFDDMGIDALLVDEAHEYKHLGFATAMQRGVKGVDQSYSKKSQGVFLKTQAVLEKNNGRNVIFATGTPISNTAAEIWTFMRYLMPADTMKEYGIYYFDDFVRNFGNIQQMLEFNTSGKFKANNRFAGYVNLPELVRIWSGVSDTVLTKEAGAVSDKIPEMEGGKAQDLYLPQTRALRGIMKFVKGELERYDKMSGKEKKENSHIPITMYGIAKAAAVDARLVQADAEDDEHSKTNEAVRQTLRSLQDTADYKGTVAIFADNYQNKHSGFNIYDDIRDKLIAEGVPADEIVVMRSGMTVKKKLEIFEKVNRGEVRVILGSTFTLGTGVNIQERLHTLIHLDAPNRPMDYTQRNGRILRQGNLHKAMGKPVRILRFGVEDSLDVTAYQRLKTKGAIADSIMNGKQMMSNSMTNRVLEEEEDVFGDTVAQLSGSEYAMLRNNAEKNMRKYASRKKQYEADQTYIHNAKPRVKAFIKDAEKRIEDNSRYLEAVRASFPDGKFKEIVIGKHRFASVEAMADYFKEYNKSVLAVMKQMKDGDIAGEQKRELTIQIGDFANSAISAALSKSGTSSDLHSLARGFSFVVTTKLTRQTMRDGATLFNDVDRKMTYSCAELGIEDIPVRQNLLRNAIEDITHNVITGRDFAERLEAAQRSKKHNEAKLEQLLSREGKPFEYEEELAQAKAQFEEYAELMKKELAEKEAKYAEMDATVEAANNLDNAEEDDVLYRKADEEYDIKAQYGLLGAGTTAIIENESDLLMLKDVIQESDYNLLKESFYHPNKYGVSIPSLRIAVVFANKAPYPESTWWHENTHIVYNGLQLEDKEECGLAALEWLRKQGRRGLVHYNLVVQNYDKEQWAEEATSRMIQYLIERYGTERFLDADFGGNEKVSKLASTIRNKFLYGTEKPTERDILQRERYIEHGSYTYNRGDNGGSYKGTWSVSSNRRQSEGGISQASEGSGGAQGADASGLARESAGSYGDDATKNKIEALFNQAISGEFKGKPISIGTLTDEGKAYLEQISGVAFKDKVDFVLNPSDLVHIYKGHFGNNETDERSIPLDIEDIRSIADVVSFPDRIIYAKESAGEKRKMFFFLKEADNGVYNLLEIYADKKGNLTAKTFYKTKEGVSQRVITLSKSLHTTSETDGATLNTKDASQRVMDIEKSLLPTSETYFGAILSDVKIPQMFETTNVEDNYSREGEGAYTDDEVSFENDPMAKVLGKPRGTRKQRREFAQRERRRMVERVESLAKRLHLDNVEIVTDASQLEGKRQRAKGFANGATSAAFGKSRTSSDLRSLARGFYSKSTGKITIVIPNHTSTADVEQTLLHEAVAHYGLRQLFGEHFNTFLDNVYNNADEDIRKRIVDIRKDLYRKYVQNAIKGVTSVFEQAEIIANLPKNEVDFTHTATEEYLAGLAENTNFEALGSDGSWWLKIKRLFLDMLEKIGFEGFSGVTLSDNELRYLLWRSYENLAEPGRHRSILGEAADVAMQYELKVGNYAMPSTPTAKVADEDLNAVNERFNEELQQQIDGTLPKGHIYQMGMPGEVLRACGFPTMPIELSSTRLAEKAAQENHIFDISEIKDLVRELNNPWAVFRYGNNAKNVIVGIEHNGKQFLVGVHFNQSHRGMEVSDIRGIFPKDNAEWLNWIAQNKADYLNKEKIQALIDKQRINLAEVAYLDLDSVAKIVKDFENPIIPRENNTGDSDDVLYRDGDSGSAREEYDRRVRRMRKANPDDKKAAKRTNRAATAHEALLDGMRALRVLQEAVAHESGKPVEDFEDAYMHENHLSSRNKTAEEAYQRDYFKPLVAEIIKATKGVKKAYKELVRYIIAKHGLERNAYMRNEAIKNGATDADQTDYAGLTALTGMDNVADAEAEAQRMVTDYEQAHDTKELWKRITAATSKSLKTRYEGGLLSKDMYEQISSQYKCYIPLKGWEETTAMDIYEYDAGSYRISPALMKAYGRKSVSDDPFATIMTDALRTIMESNRNRMKQKFLNLALNHPTDLLSVSRQWYVKQADGSWLPNNPVIPDDADADTVDAIVKQHEADMQKLHAQGKAETHRGGLNLGVVAKDADTSQHVVRVKRNGETFCIYVNGDPRAARAINGMLNPDAGEQTKIKKIAQWLKDKFAKVLTTWNLEFMFRNLCRDVMMAETAVLVKENKEYAKLYTKNVASILKFKLPQLLYKWEHGTLDDNIEIERLFREFLENGGETGFIQLNSVENVKRDMQRFLRESQSGVAHIPLKLWRGVWDGIEFMNRSAEDITRFAVYVTSRQQGRTVVRSVHDAKEITVNFNRKGSGEYGVKYLGFLYLFFNASIQAAANTGRLVKNNPKKASIAMAFFLSAGFLLPMASCILAALCGDDEDDYWDLPEWTRRNNLVLYIPFWGKYLTYPIAHELRPFYGIGEIAFSIMCGKETMEDGIRKAAEMLTGILPIDYTGNGGDAIVNFSPSLAQPVVQVYRNTDYFGKPIYKKTPWNANDPEWTKAYKNTSPILVEATRMLSEAGATADEYGVISYPEHIYTGDINPAIIEHLLESYTGGLGKTINGAAKTILMYWNEDYRELRNVPVLRTAIQSPDERAEERRFNNEYFKLYNEYKESKEYLRKLTALDKDGVMGVADRETRWIGSDAGKRYLFLDDYFKELKELEREMEEYESDDYIREIYEQEIDSVKHELVKRAS